MAFSDFPMPADYPPYARHDQVAAYFNAYVDHFGFRGPDHVRHHRDRGRARAGRHLAGQHARGPDGDHVREYDAVLVANGHHWDPRWPHPAYPGVFDGEQIHAHDYRSSAQLAGRDVVVVGSGNSALDISVEAGKVARSANLSQRRGQWVLRKFALGRPADQVVAAGLAAVVGHRDCDCGSARCCPATSRSSVCPQPHHKPGQSHPVQSEGIRDALREGRVAPRPAIERLDGDHVVFADGSRVPADLIVWATGYQVSFPFLDPELVAAKDNDLPLWKRTVHPDLPGLYFIGLLQPVGAVMPLAQAQGEWVAELLRGRYAPPPEAEIRRQMRADHERNRRQFYSSVRHTMEVDFDHYLWDLRRELRRGFDRAKASSSSA